VPNPQAPKITGRNVWLLQAIALHALDDAQWFSEDVSIKVQHCVWQVDRISVSTKSGQGAQSTSTKDHRRTDHNTNTEQTRSIHEQVSRPTPKLPNP